MLTSETDLRHLIVEKYVHACLYVFASERYITGSPLLSMVQQVDKVTLFERMLFLFMKF